MKDEKLDEYFIAHDQLMERFKSRMDAYKTDRNPETKLRAMKALDDLRGSHARISKRLSEIIATNQRVGGSNTKRKIG